MSVWRRRALAIFPEERREIGNRRTSIYLLFMLHALPALRRAHEAGDANRLRAVSSFAEWCLRQQAKDLWNAAGVSFYMLHNTLQVHGTQMAPQARGAGMALFALCLFIGQAIVVPLAAPVVDRWGATPVFWAAALVLPALALWFAQAIWRRQLATERRA